MPQLPQLVRRLRRALDADALAAAPDADLLDHFRRRRDPAAFEALVHRHGPRIHAACRRVLADPADADDAFQAAFLVLMRNPGGVRDGRSLGGWLAGVAHRVSLKALARRQRREQMESRARPRHDATTDLSWREACAILHEELDRLPDRQRLPLLLCYLEGLSRDEAATRLGRSVNTIKKALEAGRERLRKRLVRRGVTLSAGLLAAAAAPVDGEPPADFMSPVVGGTVRPAVAALARGVHTGSRLRTVGVGLAAAVVAVGIALGFPGGPKPAPVSGKDEPPKGAPKSERATVSGRVVDPDGKPVKGASVYIAGWDADPNKVATTAADGRFEFTLAPDQLAKVAHPHLMAVAERFGFTLHPLTAAGAKDITLTLVNAMPYAGHLIDRQKQPVAGARVRVLAVWLPDKDDANAALEKLQKVGWAAATGKDPAEPLSRRARGRTAPLPGLATDVHSDGKGTFTISGFGEGRFVALLVERRGFAPTEILVHNQGGTWVHVSTAPGAGARNTVLITRPNTWHVMETTPPVVGRVTDRHSGEAIRNVTIRSPDAPAYVRAVTDRDGWYQFDAARFPRRLTAEPPADAPYFAATQPGTAVVGKEDPVFLTFQLTRGVWLTGRVVEARTNTPVAGKPVRYRPHPDNTDRAAVQIVERPGREPVTRSVVSETETGPDGRFKLLAAPGRGWVFVGGRGGSRFLSAGERDLQGDVADRSPPQELPAGDTSEITIIYEAIATVTVDPDRDRLVTITLEPGILPEVRFVDPDGKPLAGVLTDDRRLVPRRPPVPIPEKFVAIERTSPERPAPLVVFHPDRGLGIAYRPTPGDAGPWTITLKPTATITARLLRRDGKPIANESVYIHTAHGGVPLSPRPMEAKTDKDGRVKITGIIGDAEYLLWCLELKDVQGGDRSRPFAAKPGEVKDLGDLRAGH